MSRREGDLLGELELPDDLNYGIQTERARRNFQAAGRPVAPALIRALAQVKQACALANLECGYLEPAVGEAIADISRAVAAGEYAGDFVTDALQGGAGTSANMNVNEVVARLAGRRLGRPVEPLAHVNLHQSTNDVFPTALRVAALQELQALEQTALNLQQALQDKEREFAAVIKLGRTQLRDAVPITLGREFGAYANAVSRDRWRIFKCAERLRVVNLGGTAIGTGLAAPRDYIFAVVEKLRGVTGLHLARAENLIDATQNQDALVEVSGILRAYAADLVKIANDLRLMSSGPEGGLGEIELPALQPGSSLMPGKINPVIPEMVVQACYRVMGHDQEIALAVMGGALELNPFLPLAADALLDELQVLARAGEALAEKCVRGIRAHPERCRELLERSPELAAALLPRIGHERAVELARLMRERGLPLRDAARVMGLMDAAELEALLQPERLCALGWAPPRDG
jgi:aspartate ammonia-lyase